MSYATVDDAVRCIKTLGRGALLAKFDIANAYRAIPVHPTDRLLLGLTWRGDTLVDGALPFCLRSAPKHFTVVGAGIPAVIPRDPHRLRERQTVSSSRQVRPFEISYL